MDIAERNGSERVDFLENLVDCARGARRRDHCEAAHGSRDGALVVRLRTGCETARWPRDGALVVRLRSGFPIAKQAA